MTGRLTEFEQRVSECARDGHSWLSWPVTVHGIELLLSCCGNCGVSPDHSHQQINAAVAAPLSAGC